MTHRLAVAIAACLAASAAAPSSAAEADVFTSAPCTADGSICVEFGTYGDFAPLNTLKFKAPGNGKVVVTATGAMQCLNNDTRTGNYGVIDLAARINAAGEPPVSAGDGVTRFAMRLGPASSIPASTALNLANTRVFKVKKGQVSFDYRFVKNRMDEGTYCYVHNLSLTAVFIP